MPTAIVHRVIRTLSTTLYRFVRKVKAGRFVRSVLKRGNREPGITFRKEIACGKHQNIRCSFGCVYYIFVVMRHTCQVTNQSSHGELSFHHNLHLHLLGAWAFLLSRCSERRLKIEKCSSPSYCHCCELCALKQKPGVLLEKHQPFLKPKSQLQPVLITASGPQA